MGTELLSNEEIVEYYKQDAMKLFRYLTWLESKSGESACSIYGGEGIAEHSVAFPVYEGTLLNFVREAEKTCFMDRNYVYVYSRNGLKTSADELLLIHRATIRDMDKLAGILAYYVMGGRTKASRWGEGLRNGVYLALLKKIKELLEFWDGKKGEQLRK